MGKGRYPDAGLDVGLDAGPGEFVDQHRGERQAVVAGGLVAIPIGVGAAPVTRETADVTLQLALVPIPLHTQPIGLGRIAGLPHGELDSGRLRGKTVPQQPGRKCSQTQQLLHQEHPFRTVLYGVVQPCG